MKRWKVEFFEFEEYINKKEVLYDAVDSSDALNMWRKDYPNAHLIWVYREYR